MRVCAGIDIGNTTTEIVIAPLDGGADLIPLAAVRAMTRGRKGSAESITAAASLLARTLRRLDVDLVRAAVAPLLPVDSEVRLVPEPPADMGRLQVLRRGAHTAHGNGTASGTAVSVADLIREPVGHDVIAVVFACVPFGRAVAAIREALAAGIGVTGVLVERDEAVLIANRVPIPLPVLDEVPAPQLVELVTNRRRVAMECRPLGRGLTQLTDPFFLIRALELNGTDQTTAQRVCRELVDASCAAVARLEAPVEPAAPAAFEEVRWLVDGIERTDPLAAVLPRIRDLPPGAVRELVGVGTVNDLFGVRLEEISQLARSRRGSVAVDATALSRLGAGPETISAPHARLAELLDVPVRLASSEAACGAAGGRSTPGVPARSVVVDLGGGTIDVMTSEAHQVLTGCGELLTGAVAAALNIPRGLADYAKRGAAVRVEAPQVIVNESGQRTFLDQPLPGSAAGSLCCTGPLGLTPFTGVLHPAEWRAWRRAAKTLLIGSNVRRGLAALGTGDGSVVLVGGAAGDDEVVACVAEQLPNAASVGRGDVANGLGHRYAVAFGLVIMAVSDS